ncbi:Fic family protein [Pontiella sp.]|uniref:Fic family protein n=2 Tax=Pontiella sp. TaxID=2837462 RepID=UPI003567AB01
MNSFRDDRLKNYALPMSMVWMLNDIAESKGKQELFTHQSPQSLKALREMALIQSAESSNRIEGVTVAADRLRPLVLGNSKPRDRSEEEVLGYRRALNEIHHRYEKLAITPDTLMRLHELCQSGGGDAGQFKRLDNDIIELVPNAAPVVRFRCVTAKDTPAAVDELCVRYRHALEQDHIPPMAAIAGLVLDFLCIHPFRDGNGRVSRLLTLLVLYQHGYEVGRYVSIERMIEESKEDYYECLQRSSQNWHDGRHDLAPWFNFLFAIVRRSYVEFEKRAGQVTAPRGSKAELVLAAIREQPGEFRLAEIERACPGVGREWIRSLLRGLKESGDVECSGKGPAARWSYSGSKGSNS